MDKILILLIIAQANPVLVNINFIYGSVSFIVGVLTMWVLMTSKMNKRINEKVSKEIHDTEIEVINKAIEGKVDLIPYKVKMENIDSQFSDIKQTATKNTELILDQITELRKDLRLKENINHSHGRDGD